MALQKDIMEIGTVLQFSRGNSSDYSTHGLYIVLKDLDFDKEFDQWLIEADLDPNADFEGQEVSTSTYAILTNMSSFLTRMEEQGYLIEKEYRSIHVSEVFNL